MDDAVTILVREGVLDETTAAKARGMARTGSLEDALRQVAGENRYLRVLARHFDIPYVELAEFSAPREFLNQFPAKVLLSQHVLPLREENGTIVAATSRIFDTTPIDELRLATGKEVRAELASQEEIDRCIKRLLGIGADTLQSLALENDGVKVLEEQNENLDLTVAAEDASIIRFVNQVLQEALEARREMC